MWEISIILSQRCVSEKIYKGCCFRSLYFTFFYAWEAVSSGDISREIEFLLYYRQYGYTSRIKFETSIMLDK